MGNMDVVDLGGDTDALPFNDLDDSHLHYTISWELHQRPDYILPYGEYSMNTSTSVQVGDDYYRAYEFGVDLTFNLMKAAIMREERLKKRGQLQLKDLSKLLTMPLEIILSIFDHLHPVDLYHLGMVSRSMRGLIYSSTVLWESVWEASGMPECRGGWGYKRWAALLFGPAVCDSCGKFIALPDYALLKRYCTRCLRAEFTWDAFSDDQFISSLIPGTPRSYGWEVSSNEFSNNFEYGARSKAQICRMRKRIKKLIAQAEGGAVRDELIAKFIQSRQEEVRKNMEHARRWNKWAFDLLGQFSQGVMKTRLRTLQKLQKRMQKEGFIAEDFAGWENHVRDLWYSHKLVDLTKSSWKRCMPSIVQMAEQVKCERLTQERLSREAHRREGLLAAYTEYLQKVSPVEWWNIPSREGMLKLPACLALVDDPSEKSHTEEEFTQFMSTLNEELTHWREDRKEKLILSLPPKVSATSLPIDSQLQLATVVFSCPGCAKESDAPVLEQVGAAMFGWDEAKRHFHCSHLEARQYITFDPVASNVVLSLLEFLGLPETTAARELDELNQRFLCGRCALSRFSRGHGLYAMTWRECVIHIIDGRRKDSSHDAFGWHLLTPLVHDYVIKREPHDLKPMDYAWYCTHCNIHMTKPVMRSSVVEHLQFKHNIKRIDTSIDLIYSPLEKRKARKRMFIPVVPNRLLCNLCVIPKDKRFLDRTSIEMHVRDKHNIEPNENEHWEAIQPILRCSADVDPLQFTLNEAS